MMKSYKLFSLIIFIYYTTLSAQNVGIGTSTPDASAALDVNVNALPANGKKGILLPRVSLLNNTDATTIDTPANGLIVYNTANNGSGTAAVVADTFYFWNGSKWTDLVNIETVKKELLPQVFFIAEKNATGTTPQTTSPAVNTNPVTVTYSAGSIVLNTGNNITLNSNYTLTINNSGAYEISGFINYNPNVGITSATNLEYIIQFSTDGITWTNAAKTTGVWGYGTGLNNRTNNISPIVLNLSKNNLIRCVVQKTVGVNHGTAGNSTISAPTGLTYGKVLRIQKLN